MNVIYIYGELLAKKLKQINETNRLIVMHRIDNLVFEYRMNNAVNISTASCSSSPESATTLPFNTQNTDSSLWRNGAFHRILIIKKWFIIFLWFVAV